jgi:hypothetical protein
LSNFFIYKNVNTTEDEAKITNPIISTHQQHLEGGTLVKTAAKYVLLMTLHI